jgi:hypothetical protein
MDRKPARIGGGIPRQVDRYGEKRLFSNSEGQRGGAEDRRGGCTPAIPDLSNFILLLCAALSFSVPLCVTKEREQYQNVPPCHAPPSEDLPFELGLLQDHRRELLNRLRGRVEDRDLLFE